MGTFCARVRQDMIFLSKKQSITFSFHIKTTLKEGQERMSRLAWRVFQVKGAGRLGWSGCGGIAQSTKSPRYVWNIQSVLSWVEGGRE